MQVALRVAGAASITSRSLRTHPVEVTFRQGGRAQLLNVRSWPFWQLPRPLIAFVAAVVLAAAAALRGCGAVLPVRVHDLEVFALLLACNGATVELTRR